MCSGHGGSPTEGQTPGSEDILHAAQHQAQEQCCYGDEGVPGAPAWYGNIIFLLSVQECAALTNSSPSKLKCSLVSRCQTLYPTVMLGKGLVTCPYRTCSAGMSCYPIMWYCQVGVNWASGASPTLGCSIEISRDICIYICMSVCLVCQINCVGRITWTKHAHAQSLFFWQLNQ